MDDDPGEEHNAYRPDHPQVSRLLQELQEWTQADTDERAPVPDSEDLEPLRSLGYVD